ncbi:hypothetical protein [Nonomuraea sp. NPDC003804]|uniref:hypothetical protein n=1 Tax=Nonomuraea sp. NPDC003804 TaxID=3154547 RepID=UPI0033BB65E9
MTDAHELQRPAPEALRVRGLPFGRAKNVIADMAFAGLRLLITMGRLIQPPARRSRRLWRPSPSCLATSRRADFGWAFIGEEIDRRQFIPTPPSK